MFKSKHPRPILNEIKWRFDLNKCKVYYIHRGAPEDTKIVDGGTIKKIDRAFLILEGKEQDVYIPYHRIFRIDFEGRPVYMHKKPSGDPANISHRGIDDRYEDNLKLKLAAFMEFHYEDR
ncbi:MAG: RNA repair domain-containing protein [Candidatus Methanoperedens sp.]|nr:RNA repair domain-containing protein [Candidatus Methanoperedens sp.]MCZ7369580.1 RNA repair domain-containing protein [Candidatus Methanoperedens sp.]